MLIFVVLILQQMMENGFELPVKVIDETRQGEAYMDEAMQQEGRKFFIESYGCQMNFSDSEIVASILKEEGFSATRNFLEADLILVNTCAIRENAELRVRQRLNDFKIVKRNKPEALVGVLGCMAERLKAKFLEEEKLVDIVVGPDAYRDLPGLVNTADEGQKAINVLLSREETYADISPVRLNSNGITAFVSITRGCDNMCSFCVVPFTRGRERSRDPQSIVEECRQLFEQGYREVTLLGQNVDSYLWYGGGPKKDFEKQAEEVKSNAVTFAQLMEMVALIDPKLRVRFSTSNPRDMTDEVLRVIARYPNICKYIHLPVQSGSSRILEKMNRGHNREEYMARIRAIRNIIPGCAISTDMIVGFCSETEEEHQESLSLMEWVNYELAYMFAYSERPGTPAAKKFVDDVPEEVKKRRLNEMIALQNRCSLKANQQDVGKVFEVLVEGTSKRSEDDNCGRTSQNKMVVFPKGNSRPGDYVQVMIESCSSATLKGRII
ncbi:MAG: tRNA (N6-isopentenyl adenosine(37)-C2)-methylthiotransferase MiaB [Chitinophagales bacterium]|nr:tRNA (N6-isopentenyl adenosine(37)-C2)-methylthiotransferase MiaB [Chitinophagales bacterium]